MVVLFACHIIYGLTYDLIGDLPTRYVCIVRDNKHKKLSN